ncbi:MAG TPA: TonB-dependent receptor [Longimicrobiales bacterium]|nr:TonB-dependent receptor [Longimicrobiales bacterium]
MIYAPVAAQSIRGAVVDDESSRPITGSLVQVFDQAGARVSASQTGSDGRFHVRLPNAGSYALSAERLGYGWAVARSLHVRVGEVLELELRLPRLPIPLEPLTVRVERRLAHLERVGFYQRERMGIGRFITAEDIEARRPLILTDVLRGEPSVRVLNTPDGAGHVIAFRGAHTMYLAMGHDACLPVVVLDGTRLATAGDVNLVHPENVAAIELYPSGNGAPPQFGGLGAPCGVIMIWTKRG